MKRGVRVFTKPELEALTNCINWEQLPEILAARIQAAVNEETMEVKIFLSEEDTENVLDALNSNEIMRSQTGKNIYTKLQQYLTYLRKG